MKFVVHEHHSTRLHFDFRLEIAGVLKSWAIPKGPSLNPADKRLAVMVEDHPLEYGEFEGIIPEGYYGAGPVLIWDTGEFQPEGDPESGLKNGKLSFSLDGKKLKGGFSLILMRGRGSGKDWLLIKAQDSSAKKDWVIKDELTPAKMKKLEEKIPHPAKPVETKKYTAWRVSLTGERIVIFYFLIPENGVYYKRKVIMKVHPDRASKLEAVYKLLKMSFQT